MNNKEKIRDAIIQLLEDDDIQDVDGFIEGIIDMIETYHETSICKEHKVVTLSCKCPGPHLIKWVDCPGKRCPFVIKTREAYFDGYANGEHNGQSWG